MFLYKYLSDTIKATALFVGLNGLNEKIDLKNAYQHIDDKVSRIESYFNISIDTDKIDVLKNDLLRLSYNYEIDMEVLQREEALFEQQLILGFPNATLPLHRSFSDTGFKGGIYQFIANTQRDDFSGGWSTVANALAIEKYLQDLKDDPPSLNAVKINEASLMYLLEWFRQDLPEAFSSEERLLKTTGIEELGQTCGLNKERFEYFIQEIIPEYISSGARNVLKGISQNKLHILTHLGLGEDLTPAFLVDNPKIAMEKKDFINTILFQIRRDFRSCETNILQNLIESKYEPKPQDTIDIENALTAILDLDYLKELLRDLDEIERERILRVIVDKGYPSSINAYVVAKALSVQRKALDITSKELTLITLAGVVLALKNDLDIEKIDPVGPIIRLVYFKALSDYFEELKRNDQNGALYFACNIGMPEHWFLIAVIKLRGISPIIVIMDSMNAQINDPLKWCYVRHLYNLFIKGKAERLNEKLEIELTRLTSPEKLCSTEDHLLQPTPREAVLYLKQKQDSAFSVFGDNNKKKNKNSTTGSRRSKGGEKGSGNSSPQPHFLTLGEAIAMAEKGNEVDYNKLTEKNKKKFLAREYTSGKGKERYRVIQSPPPSRESRNNQQRSDSGGHIDKCEKKSQ